MKFFSYFFTNIIEDFNSVTPIIIKYLFNINFQADLLLKKEKIWNFFHTSLQTWLRISILLQFYYNNYKILFLISCLIFKNKTFEQIFYFKKKNIELFFFIHINAYNYTIIYLIFKNGSLHIYLTFLSSKILEPRLTSK